MASKQKQLVTATMKVKDLIPYDRNPRIHSEAQVDKLCASMKEFGFTIPILVCKGVIVAGHGRFLAARRLIESGLKEFQEVPVIVADHWTKAQMKAYVIADNKLAQSSAWDNELLKAEMKDLKALGVDLTMTAFDEAEHKVITGDWITAAQEATKPSTPGKQRGSFTVSFDEVDREEVREAIDNAITELSVDNVSIS